MTEQQADQGPSIDRLLERWRSLGDRGAPFTLDALCEAGPEPKENVRDKLQAVASMLSFLDLTAFRTTDGAGDPPAFGASRFRDVEGEESDAKPSPSQPRGSRYEVVRVLARGGLGEVFVAWDKELGREVALKEIQGRFANDQRSRLRFVREAEITGRLEHPGIVPVYSLGRRDDGQPYYAMRFVRGENLKDAADRYHAGSNDDLGARAVAFRQLVRHFVGVCYAVDYAHSRNLIHRDIKPANVMLGWYGETLLVDWGLARPFDKPEPPRTDGEDVLDAPSASSEAGLTVVGFPVGTPAFMSPEQASKVVVPIGPATDVYSLGATLYYLLTGRAPFEGRDLVKVLERVRRGDVTPPRGVRPGVDPALAAVCLKAMATKPGDRYPTARALVDDVERWMADEPVSAWREPVSRRLRRWARRHRTAAAALGLTLVSTTAILAVSTYLVNHARQETARALGRVVEEQGQTKAALARADLNFRRARQAVDDYLTAVSEEVLLDEAGMQPLREKLLRTAQKYHQAFLRERAGDPEVTVELAQSHRLLGNIATLASRHDEARAHLQAALDSFEALAARYPDDPGFQHGIARSLSGLAFALAIESSQPDASVQLYRRAIGIFERLLQRSPADAALRRELAEALSVMGLELNGRRGAQEEAGRALVRAESIMRQLTAEEPNSLLNRMKLAEIHHDLYAGFVGSRARQAEALQHSEDALRLYRDLTRRVPNSPRFRLRLGQIHHSRAQIYLRTGRPAEFLSESREARRILSELVRDNPSLTEFRPTLAEVCDTLGHALIESGNDAEALDPLREARASFEEYFAANPGSLRIQYGYLGNLNNLGGVYQRLGRIQDAIDTLRRAMEVGGELCRRDPENLFYQGETAGSMLDLAQILCQEERHAEAVAVFAALHARASSSAAGAGNPHGPEDDEDVPTLVEAYSLREVGRADEAERLVAPLRAGPVKDPQVDYFLARYDARGAFLLARAGGGARSVEALSARAVAALRRARLPHPQLSAVDRDAAFDLLRPHPEFQALLLDMAFPADPFAR